MKNMRRIEIPVDEFNSNIERLFNGWLLLTAGENAPGKFNPMTVSWGMVGVLWNRPVVQVVVRPSRYTYEFIEKYDTFTVCAFPASFKKTVLTLLGTKSGRDIDKIKESGLTPIPSSRVAAPGYEEAELIIECKKSYFYDLEPANFLEDYIEPFYNGTDYHRCYVGEILAIHGTEKYWRK